MSQVSHGPLKRCNFSLSACGLQSARTCRVNRSTSAGSHLFSSSLPAAGGHCLIDLFRDACVRVRNRQSTVLTSENNFTRFDLRRLCERACALLRFRTVCFLWLHIR